MKEHRKSRTASCLQIQTHQVRPVRPFERFKPVTVIHSGQNPNGNFLSFTSKDVKTCIDVHRDIAASKAKRA
jgi:hypothetical protein